jgi:hydroxymethylglutaryl-CoA reductase (NADPH)
VALDMLTDEEVIMLAQHGKIAVYASEKVCGRERLERAVRVRRALVCEFLSFAIFFVGY